VHKIIPLLLQLVSSSGRWTSGQFPKASGVNGFCIVKFVVMSIANTVSTWTISDSLVDPLLSFAGQFA
jgi:hypothetical protein